MDKVHDVLSKLGEDVQVGPAEEIEDAPYNYEGFQVVRGQFFAHLFEPSLTYNRNRVYINSVCLKKMPDVEYVNFLISAEDRRVIIRPVTEDVSDSVKWCVTNGQTRKPRQMTAKIFWAKTMALMDWNPIHRYKIIGKMVRVEGDVVFAFELDHADIFKRTITDDKKEETSRTPTYSADWQDSFGLPFYEHQKRLKINIRDGYAVFSMEETPSTANKPAESSEAKNEQS